MYKASHANIDNLRNEDHWKMSYLHRNDYVIVNHTTLMNEQVTMATTLQDQPDIESKGNNTPNGPGRYKSRKTNTQGRGSRPAEVTILANDAADKVKPLYTFTSGLAPYKLPPKRAPDRKLE